MTLDQRRDALLLFSAELVALEGLSETGDGGEVSGVGRFDAALEAAPEIDFPADPGTEPQLPVTVVDAGVLGRREVGRLAAGGLRLRKLQALRDTELGPGFEHPQPGDFERVVFAACRFDQLVQDGVVEQPPPFHALDRCGRETLAGRL